VPEPAATISSINFAKPKIEVCLVSFLLIAKSKRLRWEAR
jgi:hypothetical protein